MEFLAPGQWAFLGLKNPPSDLQMSLFNTLGSDNIMKDGDLVIIYMVLAKSFRFSNTM